MPYLVSCNLNSDREQHRALVQPEASKSRTVQSAKGNIEIRELLGAGYYAY